jgi:hypothetical protein
MIEGNEITNADDVDFQKKSAGGTNCERLSVKRTCGSHHRNEKK